MLQFKEKSWKLIAIIAALMLCIGLVGCASAKELGKASAKPDAVNQENITMLQPSVDSEFISTPKVDVPVNMEVVKNSQQSVDQGHSPWQLDPLQVTMTFVSVQIYPQGVTGEFPIKMEDMKIVQQTDSIAVVDVGGDKTPTSRVYLKRLIRQDNTGIWTVVGYDPKEK